MSETISIITSVKKNISLVNIFVNNKDEINESHGFHTLSELYIGISSLLFRG